MGVAHLQFTDENGSEQTVALDRLPATLGRHPRCTLPLSHETISRQHAKIFASGRDLFVADLNSTHGLRVNGKKVSRHALKDGDQIQLGKFEMVFRAAEPDAAAGVAGSDDGDAEFELEMPDQLLGPVGEDPFEEEKQDEPGPAPPGARQASPTPAAARSAPVVSDRVIHSAAAKSSRRGDPLRLLRQDLDQRSASTRWTLILVVVAGAVLLGYGAMKLMSIGSGPEQSVSDTPREEGPRRAPHRPVRPGVDR